LDRITQFYLDEGEAIGNPCMGKGHVVNMTKEETKKYKTPIHCARCGEKLK